MYTLSGIQPTNFIWQRHRFFSLVICSGRRAKEAHHRGYGNSPSQLHFSFGKFSGEDKLQLERVLHRGQVGKAAHSSK